MQNNVTRGAVIARKARLTGRGVALWFMACGSLLQACATNGGAQQAEVGTASAPEGVPEAWYDVVSRQPGPEVSDAAMRRKLEASGHPWKVRDRATGIELVLVMPGEFLMGSPQSEPGRNADEGPRHRVRLTKAFYLGATEVTQAQWRRTTGSDRGSFVADDKPADGSWDDLQVFLSAANAELPIGTEPLRAPTEAEWEYACRAGTTEPFSFAGPPRHDLMNFNDGVVESAYIDGELKVVDGRLQVLWETPASPDCRMTTAAAGSLPPNAWGLHEMHGNLCEWTADAYVRDAYASRGALTVDPFEQPMDEQSHTLRGGDWYASAIHSRSAVRDEGGTHARSHRLGFRVARTL